MSVRLGPFLSNDHVIHPRSSCCPQYQNNSSTADDTISLASPIMSHSLDHGCSHVCVCVLHPEMKTWHHRHQHQHQQEYRRQYHVNHMFFTIIITIIMYNYVFCLFIIIIIIIIIIIMHHQFTIIIDSSSSSSHANSKYPTHLENLSEFSKKNSIPSWAKTLHYPQGVSWWTSPITMHQFHPFPSLL